MTGLVNTLATFLILFSLLIPSECFFGKKQSKEDEEAELESAMKVNAGLNALRETASDPRALREALADLNDPEIMREVQEMMKDPSFIKQMEKLKSDPQFSRAMNSAKDIKSDPEELAAMYAQLSVESSKAKIQRNVAEANAPKSGAFNAQLGMQQMSKAALDPSILAEAMELMKDPETMREVQMMMKDPAFQQEMRKYTENPAFREAAEKAKEIASDPVKMEKIQAQLNNLMNS